LDYIKKYKSFINSQQVSEGVRLTSGVLLPAFLFAYFNMLPTGIVVALGALFVSVTDSPGPIHHRRNGMFTCVCSIAIASLLTGFAANNSLILAIFLGFVCFFYSMINIYGARAGSIGTASMIVVTLNIDPHLNLDTPTKIVEHSILMATGGIWYMCYSLLLYNFRPYRLGQQALGDCIQATAEYFHLRANLYKKDTDYDSLFRQLLQQQADVQHKQVELNELLFKTRSIVKESTNVGRTLVMIHLDVAEIFERIMMSHQKYEALHKYFDETDILDDYYSIAQELAIELDEIGIAVKSGRASAVSNQLQEHIDNTVEKLDKLRETYLKPDNIEGFISLRRIIQNIQDLADRLSTLHRYTNYDRSFKKTDFNDEQFQSLISSQPIKPALLITNLTLKSDTFRHSLRVCIAVITGFIVAKFFNIGHSYWILLTIIVILKPAFSLTKKRNGDRLAGTFAGVIIGLIILFLVDSNAVLLALLILFMAIGYTFMRTNYFLSVLFMTPYLILFYNLLHPDDLRVLLKDRIVDTVIGSAIAFIASSYLFPIWERNKLKSVMISMLTEVKKYFAAIVNSIETGKTSPDVQLARKDALVSLANLTDAFNRMLSEPRSQRKGADRLHQFVVLNHMLTSYIATLSHYIETGNIANEEDFTKVAADIERYITESIHCLNTGEGKEGNLPNKDSLREMNKVANRLLKKRREELTQGLLETSTRKSLFDLKSVVDQFNLIYNVSIDINKITQSLAITLLQEEGNS